MVMVDDNNFDAVVGKSDKPVLFVIGAMWCPDCQRLQPLMMQLIQKYAGKFTFVRADFDTEKGLKERLDIRSIPTMVIFKAGKETDRLVEPKSIAPVLAVLEKALT